MTTPTEARQLIEQLCNEAWLVNRIAQRERLLGIAKALEAFLPTDETETVEDLEALPTGTVLRLHSGIIARLYPEGWSMWGTHVTVTQLARALPARVIWSPVTREAPTTESRSMPGWDDRPVHPQCARPASFPAIPPSEAQEPTT